MVYAASMSKKASNWSRRRTLKAVGTVAATAAVGCGDDEASVTGGTTVGPGGSGAGASGGAGATGGQGGSGTGGAGASGGGGNGGAGGSGPVACDDNGGLGPDELLAPIDTIVVLCMENRSFDHYLGGSLALVEGRPDIEGLTGNESNPAPNGPPVTVFQMSNLEPEDPPHGWDEMHANWNNGANDGFVIEHAGPSQHEVMGYYVRSQIPIHHALADDYVVCNHNHAALLGPTWPNRFYLHGATSNGRTSNLPVTGFDPIFDVLEDAGISHRNYHHSVAWATGGYFKLSGNDDYDQFKADAAAGTLPAFSIIDPEFFGGGANDDHPSNAQVPLAQLLIADVYATLAASPQWSSCLFIVTYDENGGFYDHVPPPATVDLDPEFAQLGFRIPGLVAGPYVRTGCAVNTTLEHVSVISTLTRRFGLPSFNARAAATNDYSSVIDPEAVKNRAPKPPIRMPALDVSMSALRRRFDALGSRFAFPDQHPELLDVLRQQGLLKRIQKKYDQRERLADFLEDARRRGLVRLRR